MADVFLSYARQDESVARRAARALTDAGLEVWWDADLPAHRSYSEIIERNLAEAKAVVVLWSAASAKSQWVRAEADVARNAGKLVQAQLDGTLPPLPFNQVQCADLRGWRGRESHAGWAKLKASVQALLSGEEPPAQRAPSSRSDQRRGYFRWAAAAVALILLAGAAFYMLRQPAEGRKPVLAVFPFESLDQRDSSLVAGIWEDTRQALSRNPQLVVLGPNSAEELAQRGMGATKRAADYVLQASVRSVGDRIRINTNLVRTDDGAQLWSENFDRRLDDVFALQTEIATEIEGHIRGRLARSGGVQPHNIATSGEVYALYSDARARIRSRAGTPGDWKKATRQLEQVVAADPNFAPGWATLAVVKMFNHPESRDRRRRGRAEADARRAIALAPNLAAAHAALGFVLRNGPAAEAALRHAIQLDPNDYEALNWLANSLDDSRRQQKLQLYSKILEIEPLWYPALFNKLSLLREMGSIAALDRERERVEKLGDERTAVVLRMVIAEERGDFSQAVATGLDYYKKASAEDRKIVGPYLVPSLFKLGFPEIADQVSTPPGDFVPFIRTNDPKAIDMIEAEMSPRDYWTYGPLPIVSARVYQLNGQWPRFVKRYRAAVSSPEEFRDLVGEGVLPDVAPSLALALRSTGNRQESARLLSLAEKAAAQSDERGVDHQITLARIYAAQGRKEEALAQLASAVQRGWFPPFLPIHVDLLLDPPLAELKDDPRFQRIRQQILAHIAKERAELGPVKLG